MVDISCRLQGGSPRRSVVGWSALGVRGREGLKDAEQLKPPGKRLRLAETIGVGDDGAMDAFVVGVVKLDDDAHGASLGRVRNVDSVQV
jgi:hypothetical protein